MHPAVADRHGIHVAERRHMLGALAPLGIAAVAIHIVDGKPIALAELQRLAHAGRGAGAKGRAGLGGLLVGGDTHQPLQVGDHFLAVAGQEFGYFLVKHLIHG